MNILGFAGPMGSGKSTAIEMVTELYDGPVRLIKFAQPLYDMQEMIYRRIKSVYQRPETFVKDRKLLQWIGTEWGRDSISTSLWVDLWKAAAKETQCFEPGALIVCDDVRFDNEADMLKHLGGNLIRLECSRNSARIDTTSGIANHKSESGLDPKYADATVSNDGTVREFREAISSTYQLLGFKKADKR